ncbi:MAG: Bifunctional hemolysin/adenylate cyclase [Pseudomonadota bacterium]|jgi:serralysin
MATVLTNAEINALTTMRTQARGGFIGYWEIYKWLADTLRAKNNASDTQTILWLRGATEANAGRGTFSTLIRAYTEYQSKLRYGAAANALDMQVASNAVAENLIKDLLGENADWPKGGIPDINRIAKSDATAVGAELFGPKLGHSSQDTAFTVNSAWSGALLFSLLGSDQTNRLISTGSPSVIDTLNDVRDVMYAGTSYAAALRAARNKYLIESQDQQLVDDSILSPTIKNYFASNGSSYNLWDTVYNLWDTAFTGTSNSIVKPAFALIRDIGPGHFLDMLMGAAQAKPIIGATTEANFEANAKAFFNNYSQPQLQGFKAELLPTDVASLTAKGKSDANARAALMALSAVSVEVSSPIASKLDLYDVANGTGHISDKWLEDRASMLVWLKVKFQMETSGAVSNSIDGPGSRYFDQASNTEVLIGTLPTDRKQYLFGSNNVDNLIGQDLDDHLFGGEGGDNLSGAGGDVTDRRNGARDVRRNGASFR